MAAQEIFPIVCDPFSDPETWARVAKDVDVGMSELPHPFELTTVVDALASIGLKEAQLVFHTFLKAVKHRSSCLVLPTFVYCSGHYVMARGLEWTDERQPALAPCNPGSAWRRTIEDAVLTSKAVNGIVIRPVCLYGKGGSYFGEYHFRPTLDALRKGKKRFKSIVGDSGKIATVHCDDAAELFVAVAERVS